MSHIRVGLIGTGKMGRLHLKKLQQSPNAQFMGFFDTDFAAAENLAKETQSRFFGSLQELLFEIDALIIAAPTAYHHSIARGALENGVSVLIEKPITASESEAVELIELAERKNLVLQVGHLERFRLRKLSEEVPFEGTPRFFETRRFNTSPGRESTIDVVQDLMIHDLDLVLSYFPEDPIQIEAWGNSVVSESCDQAFCRLHFSHGRVAQLSASRVSSYTERRFFMHSQNSSFTADLLTNEVFFRSLDQETVSKKAEALDPLSLQLEAFLHSTQTKQQAVVDGKAALRALRLAKTISEKIHALKSIPDPSEFSSLANS